MNARDRERLAADEARRADPEYQRQLVAKAPKAAAVRDRGDILPTILDPARGERIREQTLEWLEEAFGSFERSPGLTLYPYGTDSAEIRGFGAVWRDEQGRIAAGASVLEATPIPVPDEVRDALVAYDAGRETPEQRRQFFAWWAANHHRLERGEVDSVAVRKDLPRDQARAAVRALQLELARHRVYRRLAFERGPEADISYPRDGAFVLSVEGARSLNAHRASKELTTGAVMALVKNPAALNGLVRMPDTGRPLTEAEIARGVLDLAHGGDRQFWIEAVAVKEALGPLVKDPPLYQRTCGFALAELPGVSYLVRDTRADGTDGFHLEEATGEMRRLEYHNAPVRPTHPGRSEDPEDGPARAGGGARGEREGGPAGREEERETKHPGQLICSPREPDPWAGVRTTKQTAGDERARGLHSKPTTPAIDRTGQARNAGPER